MLLAGLSCLGAAIGIGLVGSRTPPDDAASRGSRERSMRAGSPPERGSPRQLAIVVMAFCMGIAVLGVVVGLLAVILGPPVRASTNGLIAALPAIAGTGAGLAIVARNREAADDRTSRIAGGFLFAIGALGVALAILAYAIVGDGQARPPDWAFPLLGLVTIASTLGMGLTTAATLAAMRDAGPEDRRQLHSRQLVRVLMLDATAVAASAIGVALVAMV
jgi:hypothetical protein